MIHHPHPKWAIHRAIEGQPASPKGTCAQYNSLIQTKVAALAHIKQAVKSPQNQLNPPKKTPDTLTGVGRSAVTEEP
jgi:hypothetical protein